MVQGVICSWDQTGLDVNPCPLLLILYNHTLQEPSFLDELVEESLLQYQCCRRVKFSHFTLVEHDDTVRVDDCVAIVMMVRLLKRLLWSVSCNCTSVSTSTAACTSQSA